ncbi:unnamed protein product [Paramecium primaurelia]|uniref:PQ-loop repeat-containing protein n=1 Tax=Paramecium primaurelia TaxID=5886 RepID=A0A8S1JT83_PARPR|nr:unnamed protein product [Paramecium primaurelia]
MEIGQFDDLFQYASQLADLALNVGFVLGPLIGYVAQYQLIKQQKSVGSFSTDVCAILLFANLLRIVFWYEKRFESALLYQSVLMIMMQVELLRLCLTIKNKSVYKNKPVSFFDSPLNKFWRWTQLNSYIACLITFLIFVLISSYLNLGNPQYWEIIGFLSCAIEATLGLPQAIKNHTSKSVKGLSYTMIGSWFLGDAFKTFYFIVKNQPAQFVMCGVIQLSVDIWIMLQIAVFSSKKGDLAEI